MAAYAHRGNPEACLRQDAFPGRRMTARHDRGCRTALTVGSRGGPT